MHVLQVLVGWKPWRKYARRARIGALELHLVPLEEHHRYQLEQFHDRLDAETVYLRHGTYFSALLRKSPAWLARQWNKEGQDGFSQGAFLNGRLMGIGSIYKLPGSRLAEAALVVAPEFQGLGRGGETGVGGLLVEDLIRYALHQGVQRVTAYFAVPNPRCERLLRKYGFEISTWSHREQESSAMLDLSRFQESQAAGAARCARPPGYPWAVDPVLYSHRTGSLGRNDMAR